MCFSARRLGRAGRRVSVGPAEARAAACFSTLFPEIHHFSVEAGPSKSGKTRTAKVRGLNYHQSQSVSRLTEMGGFSKKRKKEVKLQPADDFMSTGNLKMRWLHSARGSGPPVSFVSCLPASPSPPVPQKKYANGNQLVAQSHHPGIVPPPYSENMGLVSRQGAGPLCQPELRAGTADGKPSSCDGCQRSYFEPRVESRDHLLTDLLTL